MNRRLVKAGPPQLWHKVAHDMVVARPVLRVQRSFARNSVLYCQFSVYGATRGGNGQTFMPQVSAGCLSASFLELSSA
jgi:hypothetical protein